MKTQSIPWGQKTWLGIIVILTNDKHAPGNVDLNVSVNEIREMLEMRESRNVRGIFESGRHWWSCSCFE